MQASPPPSADSALDEYRTPFESLTERSIGKAARPVRYDWRKSTVGFGLVGSELYELNNFWTARAGALVRTPVSGAMVELAFSRVQTWSTESSLQLSMTPYRQYGRPSRFELDINVGVPLAEGVVTAWPRFFPAAEMVLSATLGFRYLLYTNGFGGMKFLDVTGAIFSPALTAAEQSNLVAARPPGMQVDSGRYGLMVGFTTDIYLASGLFLSPRGLIALPLLSAATQTHLGLWWELSLAAGLSL